MNRKVDLEVTVMFCVHFFSAPHKLEVIGDGSYKKESFRGDFLGVGRDYPRSVLLDS